MKKTIVGMAMMAMVLVGFNGMAQNNTQGQQSQVENRMTRKGDKKGMMKERKNPYEGLNLTDAQKTKLAELDAKQQAKRQAAMEARKEGKSDKKAEMKNMTETEIQALIQQRNDARKAEKVEYLQEVKEIVGPDQYVVFLENMYINGGQQGSGKAFRQGQKGQKGMAHGQKAGKGQRKNGQQNGQRKAAQTPKS